MTLKYPLILFIGVVTSKLNAQNDLIGIRLFSGPSGITFSNSEGKTFNYNKRLSTGWMVQYAHTSKSFIVEAGCGFSRMECSYEEPGLNTQLSMDFFRTSLTGSGLLFKGPVRLKLGGGLGTGHLLAGYQTTSGEMTNVKTENTFKNIEITANGEAGLLFQPSEKIQMQLSYTYRMGLTSLENVNSQSTKINANGLQVSVYFGI
jgi:hypothetical protein